MGMLRTSGFLIVLLPMTLILSLVLWVVVGRPDPPGPLYYAVCYVPPAACIGFSAFIGFQDPPLNADE